MRAGACVVFAALAGSCTLVNPAFDPQAASDAGSGTASAATTAGTATTLASTTASATTSAVTTAEPTTDGTTTTTTTATTTTLTTSATDSTTTGEPACEPQAPPTLAGREIVMAAAFAAHYTTYELGPVPGIPAQDPLGGMSIHFEDDDVLLIAGDAEKSDARLYQIPVERGPCGHILGFAGRATVVAQVANISDLFYTSAGLMFYSEWDKNFIAQLLPGETTPSLRIDLDPLGVAPSPGGIALVPPGLAAAGELRVLSYQTGAWYHLERAANGDVFDLGPATEAASIVKASSGVAYVPAGSPGFDQPSVLVSQDVAGRVLVYPVDDQGDPIAADVQALFTDFPYANTTSFDRVTGDLMIATIAAPLDKVYVVQGFAAPPPLQE